MLKIQDLGKISTQCKAKIGLYTVGLKPYWSQFPGLRERIIKYGAFVGAKMENLGGEIYNFGLVDYEVKGREAGEYFCENNVDIIFCLSATYVTSSALLPLHQICKKPAIILNLQPALKMNYDKTSTGEWLAHCGACPVPEFSNLFNRAKIKFRVINGLLGLDKTPDISVTDEVTNSHPLTIETWNEIEEWINAAATVRTLQYSNVGFLGNTYSGMLDMYSDVTMIQAQTGVHVTMLEMCDFHHYFEKVTDKEISEKLDLINSFFDIAGDSKADSIVKKPNPEQLSWSAKIAVAQEKLIKDRNIDALTYYYHGQNNNLYEQMQGGFIVGHSLLTAQGVPCSGEGDLKNCIAMKICDTLDVGGSYTEIVGVDYEKNTIILGHDGPFHIKIANSKPMLRGLKLYHGKLGSGISVEANVVKGKVTTLCVTQTIEDGLKMIVSEGTSLDEPILTIGNTQTHVSFNESPKTFMDRWFQEHPTHHCSLSVGHNAAKFEKFADLMNIKIVKV